VLADFFDRHELRRRSRRHQQPTSRVLDLAKFADSLARREGLEPPTLRFEEHKKRSK